MLAPILTSRRRARARRKGQQGFTLVELITVMILVGILAAVAIPRMSSLSSFEAPGFRDQTIAQLRFAQKTALAQRRAVCVTVVSSGVTLRIATADTAGNCSTGADLIPPFSTRTGSGLGGSSFVFLRRGETDGTGAVSGTISLTVAGTDDIKIDAETGYVR